MIQYHKPNIKVDENDLKNIGNILNSGWVSIGKYVEEVEDYFRKTYSVKHAIACSCATQGLIIAIKSAGWRNKRVAVQSFTWPSTIFAIEANIGNKPVFCDIHRDTLNIDLGTVSKDSYDTVIAVDVFGNEAEVNTDKPIIYDAAHGYGLKNLGHRGLAEVVSFSFTKVVTAMEGGMILTQNDEFAEIAYELRRLSARMLEINAYILLKAIKEYKANYASKNRIAEAYKLLLKLDYTEQKSPSASNYSVFPIILRESAVRNAIIKEFNEKKIEYKVYYQPMVEGLPVTDWIFDHILCLPIYPTLTDVEIAEICDVANSAAKHIHVGHNYLRNSKYIESYFRSEN